MNDAFLHLYAQDDWHGEVFIVGNTAGLKALRDAIDAALQHGAESLVAFANDGEGYYTAVVKIDDQEEFNRLAVPYTDEIAKESRDGVVWPWDMESAGKVIQKQYDMLRAEENRND